MISRFFRAEWGIAILVFAVFGYAASTAHFVALDDFKLIVGNPLLQHLDWSSLKGVFTSYDPDLYVPLTLLSYQFDRILAGGFEPWMFHLTNLVLHAVNSVLVCVFIGQLSKKRGVGIIAGLLFAVHPLQTEAVLWVSARKDLLSTFFFLVAAITYLKQKRGVSITAFLCGLLSKVSIVPLPVILLLIDWYQGKQMSMKDKIPYCILSFIFGVVALIGMEGATDLGWVLLPLASRAVWFYMQKLILPIHLSALVPFTDSVSWANPSLAVSFFCILCIFCFVWILRKKYPLLTFTTAWFLLMLVPSFGNFEKGNEYPIDIYLASDRYAYIPSIAFVFLVATGVYARTPRIRNAVVFCILCILCILSFSQSKTWRTTPELYLNVMKHYDNSHLAHNNIAALLIEQGAIDPALIELKKSIAIKPNTRAYFNLGRIAELRNDAATALKMYDASLSINSGYEEAVEYKAALLKKIGK